MAIRAVCFDIGETLINQTRVWTSWADWFGVTTLTFFALLGAAIEQGEDHRQVFSILRPDFDFERERAAQAAAGVSPGRISAADLYPDAMPSLTRLRAEGYRLGLAGNQPVEAEPVLGDLGLPVDFIATSAGWGVEKPSPAFFSRLIQEAGFAPEEIAYVGDRLDNDILPANAAGMLSVFVRRGPWGYIHAQRSQIAEAGARLESLLELPAALERLVR